MERTACPAQAPRVVTRTVSGMLVLLSVSDGYYFSLDEVGARVWELCDGTRSATEIAAVLSREYDDAPAATIAADVRELLEDLQAEGLVVTAP